MTKILITGAAGFLGFHLARATAARPGHEVVCVDNFVRGAEDEHFLALTRLQNVSFIACDLTDPAAVATLPADVDWVYHLAALNGTQNFYERPMDVIRCSTLPTIFLADHFGAKGRLKRFVYAGTSESYASTVTRFGWPVPTDETVPLGIDDVMNPRWSYAASKMHGEVVTAQAGRSYGMPFTIVRFHNAYGPRMGDKHVIPDFYARARENRFELFGYEDTRSFLYVDDAVRATVLAAESDGCIDTVVNVGGSLEITMHDLGKEMMRVRGLSGDIALYASPAGSVKRRAPDVGKLRDLTGFAESVSLDDGLKATAQFYLDDELVGPLKPILV